MLPLSRCSKKNRINNCQAVKFQKVPESELRQKSEEESKSADYLSESITKQVELQL